MHDFNPKVKLAAVLIAAGLALPGSVAATVPNWVGVNRDMGKLVFYVDQSSITRDNEGEKVWLLFDFFKPRITPHGFRRYRSVKEEVVVRCGDRSYARAREIKYSGSHGTGKVIGTHEWKPGKRHFVKVVPFTNSQAIVDFLCHSAKSGSGGACVTKAMPGDGPRVGRLRLSSRLRASR